MKNVIMLMALLSIAAVINASPIRILHLGSSSHSPAEANSANIPLDVTVVSSLNGQNLSNFDILSIDEHPPSTFDVNLVRNAVENGLGLVFNPGSTGNPVYDEIGDVLGTNFTPVGQSGAFQLTNDGANHPIFTGAGIPGNNSINIQDLDNQSRHAVSNPIGTVLATDGAGRAVIFTGTLGQGRFLINTFEPLESTSVQEAQYMANVYHFVAQGGNFAPVPEPSTYLFLGLGIFALYRRKKRA